MPYALRNLARKRGVAARNSERASRLATTELANRGEAWIGSTFSRACSSANPSDMALSRTRDFFGPSVTSSADTRLTYSAAQAVGSGSSSGSGSRCGSTLTVTGSPPLSLGQPREHVKREIHSEKLLAGVRQIKQFSTPQSVAPHIPTMQADAAGAAGCGRARPASRPRAFSARAEGCGPRDQQSILRAHGPLSARVAHVGAQIPARWGGRAKPPLALPHLLRRPQPLVRGGGHAARALQGVHHGRNYDFGWPGRADAHDGCLDPRTADERPARPAPVPAQRAAGDRNRPVHAERAHLRPVAGRAGRRQGLAAHRCGSRGGAARSHRSLPDGGSTVLPARARPQLPHLNSSPARGGVKPRSLTGLGRALISARPHDVPLSNPSEQPSIFRNLRVSRRLQASASR